jgi:hypothetical protein
MEKIIMKDLAPILRLWGIGGRRGEGLKVMGYRLWVFGGNKFSIIFFTFHLSPITHYLFNFYFAVIVAGGFKVNPSCSSISNTL